MFAARESGSRGHSQYEITYLLHGEGSGSISRDCYMVCVPLHLIHAMKDYLNRYSCKFSGQYSIDRNRAEFFIEEFGHPKMLQALVDRTLANGGKVDIPSLAINQPQIDVDLMICPLSGDQLLTIKVNGQEIPATADDMTDYEWWMSVPNIDAALSQFIKMAIDGIERDIVYYYDTRINLNLRELLESFGFCWCAEEESMRLANT